MTRIIILAMICTLSVVDRSNGQQNGVVVLKDGLVMQGEISLPSFELVILRNAAGTAVYNPFQLDQVRFYDATSDINRHYIAIQSEDPSQSRLYEMVVSGELNILRRPKLFLLRGSESDKVDYKYYVRTKDGRLTPLKSFRQSVFPSLMQSYHSSLETFLDRNDLDPNKEADAIRIIQFVNRQIQSTSITAGI